MRNERTFIFTAKQRVFSSKGIKTANKNSGPIITQICLFSRTALKEVSS